MLHESKIRLFSTLKRPLWEGKHKSCISCTNKRKFLKFEEEEVDFMALGQETTP